jgi:hypothetical protein
MVEGRLKSPQTLKSTIILLDMIPPRIQGMDVLKVLR